MPARLPGESSAELLSRLLCNRSGTWVLFLQNRQFAGLLTPTLSSGRRGLEGEPGGHLYVVVGRDRTTILPWSGRPTDCLGGSYRRRNRLRLRLRLRMRNRARLRTRKRPRFRPRNRLRSSLRLKSRFEPSNALCYSTRFGVSFRVCLQTSFGLSFRRSFLGSFLTSFDGCFERHNGGSKLE